MEKKTYLIMYNDNSTYITESENFKEALYSFAEYSENLTPFVRKAMEGFKEDEVDDLITLFFHLTHYLINSVFIIKYRLYP